MKEFTLLSLSKKELRVEDKCHALISARKDEVTLATMIDYYRTVGR